MGLKMNKEKEILLSLLMEKYGNPTHGHDPADTIETRRKRRKRTKPTNAWNDNAPWTREEIETVRTGLRAGNTFGQIGLLIGRSRGAVEIRCRQDILLKGELK